MIASAEYKELSDRCIAVGIDVNDIVSRVQNTEGYKRFKSVGPKSRMIINALNQAIRDHGDDTHKPFDETVMIFGTADAADSDKNFPVRMIGTRSKTKGGELVSIVTWETNVIPPTPCKCRVIGLIDLMTGEVRLTKSGGIFDVEEVTEQMVFKSAKSRAVQYTDSKSLNAINARGLLAVSGVVTKVNQINIWVDKKKVDKYPFLIESVERVPRKLPCFEIDFGYVKGGYAISASIPRQKHGSPTLYIDDIDVMAETGAMDALVGAAVTVVGTASSINVSDEKQITYMRMDAVYIAEERQEIQTTIEEKLKPASDPTPEPEIKETSKEEVAEPETELTPEEKLANDLEKQARTTKMDPKYIPVEKIRKTCKVPPSIDDSMIDVLRGAVSERLKEEGVIKK